MPAIEIPDEVLFGACASAVREALVESKLLEEFGEALKTLVQVRMLRDGLLTAKQASEFLGVSERTFKRQVAAGTWPEIRIMGNQEYRYPLGDMIALMNLRKNRKSATEEERQAAA